MRNTPLIDRINTELAAGRAWRAKEILRGTVARHWPDALVVERYGQILADLGDRLEAGKYLFLSGARNAEYTALIDLFLRRYGRRGAGNLVAQFPKSFRRLRFGDLPAQLQSDLKAAGVEPEALGSRDRRARLSAASRGGNVFGAVFAALVLLCFVVGIGVVFQKILTWMSALFAR